MRLYFNEEFLKESNYIRLYILDILLILFLTLLAYIASI